MLNKIIFGLFITVQKETAMLISVHTRSHDPGCPWIAYAKLDPWEEFPIDAVLPVAPYGHGGTWKKLRLEPKMLQDLGFISLAGPGPMGTNGYWEEFYRRPIDVERLVRHKKNPSYRVSAADWADLMK